MWRVAKVLDCEEKRQTDRTNLRLLKLEHPDWTHSQLAIALSRSLSWIKKWLKRLSLAAPTEPSVLFSQKRGPKTPPPPPNPLLVERILAIRDHPPDNLQRTPGPKTISYYLARDKILAENNLKPPSSASTIWIILTKCGRIFHFTPPLPKPVERPAPLVEIQLDYKDASTVTIGPEGKKQHLVEVLNLVDVGTSILVAAVAREDFNAQTTLETIIEILKETGLPKRVTFDRDPRFVGSASGRDFPSAFVKFWHCIGVKVNICPPHRPDLNSFVERYHRAYKYECLLIKQPQNLAEVREVTATFKEHYNTERPHQGKSCKNRPPKVAFPLLPALPSLPLIIDPDRWVLAVDKRRFVRRVQSSGSVTIGKYSYYLGQELVGKYVSLEVAASSQEFVVWQKDKEVKRVGLKGLIGQELGRDEYLELIIEEARAEARQNS
jgi:transposase InsO family protein